MTTFTTIAAVAAFLIFYAYLKSRPWGFLKKFGVGIAGMIAGVAALAFFMISDTSVPTGLIRALWLAGIGLFVLFMVHEARPLNLRWLKNVGKENAQAYGFGALVAAGIIAVAFDPAVNGIWNDAAGRFFEQSPADKLRSEEVAAVTACQQYVQNDARFPTKADFVGYPDVARNGGRITMQGRVELMNGMGLMVPHTYYCKFEGGKLADIKVREG